MSRRNWSLLRAAAFGAGAVVGLCYLLLALVLVIGPQGANADVVPVPSCGSDQAATSTIEV